MHANSDTLEASQIGACQENLLRTPLWLMSQSHSLFAWLHRRQEASRHGLLICPPVGYEQLHSHRSLRRLADALASRGFPVLRLDYHGTGDSSGCDSDPRRVGTWVANVKDACTWMRQELGCDAISLIGLRVGAALATLTSATEDIDNLVLWAPVIKGAQYVREMKAIATASSTASQIAKDVPGLVQAAGFVLTPETAEEMSQLDLHRITPRCSQLLIVSRDEGAADRKLGEHYSQAGMRVDRTTAPGYAEMMTEPHYGRVPEVAISTIVDWLENAKKSRFDGDRLVPIASIDARSGSANLSAGAENGPHVREQLCFLRDRPHLFGILSEPAEAIAASRPPIVLLNAGSSYRIGPGRLYVLLARQLATAGFRCLRVDLHGLGDSPAGNAAMENDPYSATAFRDIELILQFAQERLNTQKVVLMGLCSGAYVAFQAAAQSPHPAIDASILINPLTFFWADGMTFNASPQVNLSTWLFYLNAARDVRNWKRLLGGKSRLGLLGTLRNIAGRLGMLPARAATAAAPQPFLTGRYGHPTREDLPGDLRRAIAKGRHLAMFFSSTDPGYFLLKCQAARTVNRLRRTGDLDLFLLDDTDHTFSVDRARQQLISTLRDYLIARYA